MRKFLTFIWVLTNRKSEERRGKVQNEAFGYWKVTVDRPLRLAVDLSPARLERLERTCAKADVGENGNSPLPNLAHRVFEALGAGPHLDFNAFMAACDADADKHGVRLTAKRRKLLQDELCDTSEDAAPVLKKVHKRRARPRPTPSTAFSRPRWAASTAWLNTSRTPPCATASRCRYWKTAASRRSSDARCCPTPPGCLDRPGQDTGGLRDLFCSPLLSTSKTPNLGGNQLGLPQIDEQREILEHIQEKSAEIDQATTRAECEIGLMREYRTRLISDVVSGQVDVRGIEVAEVAEEELLALDEDTAESDDVIDDEGDMDETD